MAAAVVEVVLIVLGVRGLGEAAAAAAAGQTVAAGTLGKGEGAVGVTE